MVAGVTTPEERAVVPAHADLEAVVEPVAIGGAKGPRAQVLELIAPRRARAPPAAGPPPTLLGAPVPSTPTSAPLLRRPGAAAAGRIPLAAPVTGRHALRSAAAAPS